MNILHNIYIHIVYTYTYVLYSTIDIMYLYQMYSFPCCLIKLDIKIASLNLSCLYLPTQKLHRNYSTVNRFKNINEGILLHGTQISFK